MAAKKQKSAPGAINPNAAEAAPSFGGLFAYQIPTQRHDAVAVLAAFNAYGAPSPEPPAPAEAFTQAMAYLSQRGANPKPRMVDGVLRQPLLDGRVVVFLKIDERDDGAVTYRVNAGTRSNRTDSLPAVGAITYRAGSISFEGEIADQGHPINRIVRSTFGDFCSTVSDMELRTAIVKQTGTLMGVRVKGNTVLFVPDAVAEHADRLETLIRSSTGDDTAASHIPLANNQRARDKLIPSFLSDFGARMRAASADVDGLFASLSDGKRGARLGSFAAKSAELAGLMREAEFFAALLGAGADGITAGLAGLRAKLDQQVSGWGRTVPAAPAPVQVADDSKAPAAEPEKPADGAEPAPTVNADEALSGIE